MHIKTVKPAMFSNRRANRQIIKFEPLPLAPQVGNFTSVIKKKNASDKEV
jgi:hypothetical protein